MTTKLGAGDFATPSLPTLMFTEKPLDRFLGVTMCRETLEVERFGEVAPPNLGFPPS